MMKLQFATIEDMKVAFETLSNEIPDHTNKVEWNDAQGKFKAVK